ncbi:MAG: hypothetical protein M3Q42_14415 [Pseudomonadota bacterium]|nr:hypothetical protein [Pseudomonadota bacterium]
MSSSPVQAGIIVAHSQSADRDALAALARQLIEDASAELQSASDRDWQFHFEEPLRLGSDERRHAGDFLGEASLRLVEGSYDLIVILTDVALISRRERTVFGLASPLTRTVLISTHRLREADRGRQLPLDAPSVRCNTAALLLHLIGQTLGANVQVGEHGAMARFEADPDRTAVPRYRESAGIAQLTAAFMEREHTVEGPLADLWLHVRSAARHPRMLLQALLRNRAPLLSLKMPGLATAAVAPVFILVFSAEFWDAGLGMTHPTAWTYAALSILAAAFYLCFAQRLFLPRKESRLVPEHLAVANVVIFVSMLLAVIGLFVMVALLALAIELWVFPPDLISTWPTLGKQQVGFTDLLRIAVFISTVGVTTGALAGGLQRRQILRNMALYQTEV